MDIFVEYLDQVSVEGVRSGGYWRAGVDAGAARGEECVKMGNEVGGWGNGGICRLGRKKEYRERR